MESFRLPLLIIHIASAAVLLGASFGVTRLIRRSLELEAQALRLATDEGVRRAKLTGIASIATLWSGVGLIFLMGGFKVAPLNYHMALGLMFGAVILTVTVLRPAMVRVFRAAHLDVPERAVIERLLGRMGMAQGILHLVWLCILVLMFHRIPR